MKKLLVVLLTGFLMMGCQTKADDKKSDVSTSASVDGKTSASIVPEALIQNYTPKGFTKSDAKKALLIVGEPRKYSVMYDLVMTTAAYLESQGVEVEIRDLYELNFNPVMTAETFYYSKDGHGEIPKDIKTEQDFITQADYLIFMYPNWHDTPNVMVKGYMERVFAKTFAYQDTDKGLSGMLEGKGLYTIEQSGFLGGGRGFIGDGVGIDDAAWNRYMEAFKVFDDDTAAFWGVKNLGRFVNDRTPKQTAENFETELNKLRTELKQALDQMMKAL